MEKYDRLARKFEKFLIKYERGDEWLIPTEDLLFEEFYYWSNMAEPVRDYWDACELMNRIHNEKLLERSMKYEENSIRRFLNSKNSELLQVQAASYLQKRERFVDHEDNTILLYIDFKNAANLNDLSEEQEELLRHEFRIAKQDFDDGKYDYEDEE